MKPVKKVKDPYCKATRNIPGDLGTDLKSTLDWLDFNVVTL